MRENSIHSKTKSCLRLFLSLQLDSHFFAISNFVYQMLFSSQLYLKRVDQFLKSLAICWSIKRITRILAESSSSWFKVQNILNAIWAVVSWFCSILPVWAPRQRWIVVPLLSLKLTLRTAFFACHCVCWPIGQAVPEIYVKRKREQNRKGKELLNKTTVFSSLVARRDDRPGENLKYVNGFCRQQQQKMTNEKG